MATFKESEKEVWINKIQKKHLSFGEKNREIRYSWSWDNFCQVKKEKEEINANKIYSPAKTVNRCGSQTIA